MMKYLLYPFSLLYAAIIGLRNLFYETGLLKATSFNLPVINVGNLSVGGTGKTPHIEYLIRLLSPYLNVATLSRGYKRKSKGFQLIGLNDDALKAGDEPLQFKRKYPHIPVSVSESRNIGIPLLIKYNPQVQTILLDDAFQHRSVIPGYNILLTEYSKLFVDDLLLPAGRLREPKASYRRANTIIVTKCPDNITQDDQEKIIKRIKPFKKQKVYFSKYQYQEPYFLFDKDIRIPLDENHRIVLISAIANVDYLVNYLESRAIVDNIIKYEDHHYFTEYELEQLQKIIKASDNENTIFLTTEKDAMRLELHKDFLNKHEIPIFVLPVEVEFLNNEEDFQEEIKSFLLNFKS